MPYFLSQLYVALLQIGLAAEGSMSTWHHGGPPLSKGQNGLGSCYWGIGTYGRQVLCAASFDAEKSSLVT